MIALAAVLVAMSTPITAQQTEPNEATRSGLLIDLPIPLRSSDADAILAQLRTLNENSVQQGRTTVVMRYAGDAVRGEETAFEDALKLARAMTSVELRKLRLVGWVESEVRGHSTLPILASDMLLVGPDGVISEASAGESGTDETIGLAYGAIAQRRALFPQPVVAALVDSNLELALVTNISGERRFAVGEELTTLRDSGDVASEEIWSAAGVPLSLDSKSLRAAKIAAGVVNSRESVAERLDLAELKSVGRAEDLDQPRGVLLEINGAVASNRSRRWQSNLVATLESGEVNTWLIAIDSSGGDLGESAALASLFASREPPLQRVVGLIRGESRGDAALLAVACKPLLMTPGSTLGGPGSDAMSGDAVDRQTEIIAQIANQTKRPEALIRGLLDPNLVVYRYTNRRTGRIRYASEADLIRDAEDVDVERDRWERGEQVSLSDGLTVEQAVGLGLADGEAQSIEAAALRVGLESTPPPVSDRQLVRFVEKIGRSNSLAFFLLFLGFIMLSSEASAPGLGIPGFIAIICFGSFFWIKFLAGTAEWLELVAFLLGILCIGLELFVVPGFGIFGIGGLILTLLGVVLMSQTFVIPRNVYQLEVLTHGIWIALGSAVGLIAGLILIRTMMPHIPLFRGLVMELPDAEVAAFKERLADYGHLVDAVGVATTPLRPSGKARFADDVVAVVSDGAAIQPGEQVRVLEVLGNRIVVEAVES